MKGNLLVLLSICAIVSLLLIPPISASDVEIVQLPPLIFKTDYCGDGVCKDPEMCDSCSIDCGECEIPLGAKVLVITPVAITLLYAIMRKKEAKMRKEGRQPE